MALGCRAVGFCRVFWKLSHTREHEENFPKNHTELYMAVQTLQDGARAKSGGSMKSIRRMRSEEHTSELQSLRHLVCRLLLKKKTKFVQQRGSDRVNAAALTIRRHKR